MFPFMFFVIEAFLVSSVPLAYGRKVRNIVIDGLNSSGENRSQIRILKFSFPVIGTIRMTLTGWHTV
jgi:hypothetical protein